jgi:WD40 repeat protein
LRISENAFGFIWHSPYIVNFHKNRDNVVIFNIEQNANRPNSYSISLILSRNALSPNGLYFASAFDETIIPSNIFVFEGGSNRVLKQIANVEGENNGEAPFSALTFSPDSKVLAVGQYYNFVRIYNVDSGALISKIQISGLINNIKFISNGEILRISDPSISGYRLVRVSTGQTIKVVGERKPGRSAIAFSSDDKLVAIITQEDNKINIYDTLSGQTLKTFASCNEPFDLLVFSKGNKKLAVKDTANNVRVYDLKL